MEPDEVEANLTVALEEFALRVSERLNRELASMRGMLSEKYEEAEYPL
jgi:hypothetical protein